MEEKVTFARQFAGRLKANKLDKELSVIRDVIVGGRATTRNVFEDD